MSDRFIYISETIKDKSENRIINNPDVLYEFEIYEDVESCLMSNDITKYIFIGKNHFQYQFILIKKSNNLSKYKVVRVIYDMRNKKNKYYKIDMKKNRIKKIVADIGRQNAQLAHSEDFYLEKMIPFRDFLKSHPQEFDKIQVYYMDKNNIYREHRFKNLFSKNTDEISDFEKITLVERQVDKILKISFIIDDDIFDFNQNDFTLQDRKEAREFAKDVYNMKSLYKDKELLDSLKNHDLYIKTIEIIPKEHKDIWDKITMDDMNIKVLNKIKKDYFKDNTPLNKKRKYLSKRDKRVKERRTKFKDIKFGRDEYLK